MTAMETFVPSESAMRRALRRADDGVTLNPDEAQTLLHARGDSLKRLMTAASRVRDAGLEQAGQSGIITYSRKVFIPVTHLCRDRCHYCTFVSTPGQLKKAGKGMFMSPDEILDVARKGEKYDSHSI
jgi:FO synthase